MQRLKQSFLLISLIICWASSFGQSANALFKASKGTWHFPISNVQCIDTMTTDCIGMKGNSEFLVLKTSSAEKVKAIQSGVVCAIYENNDFPFVMIKNGDYFLVYEGLTDIRVKKWDTVQKGTIIGTLLKDDNDYIYELDLILMNKSKTLNINYWFDWRPFRNKYLQISKR